jgi:hypothetical protein
MRGARRVTQCSPSAEAAEAAFARAPRAVDRIRGGLSRAAWGPRPERTWRRGGFGARCFGVASTTSLSRSRKIECVTVDSARVGQPDLVDPAPACDVVDPVYEE